MWIRSIHIYLKVILVSNDFSDLILIGYMNRYKMNEITKQIFKSVHFHSDLLIALFNILE